MQSRTIFALNNAVCIIAELNARIQRHARDDDANSIISDFANEYNALGLSYQLRLCDGTWMIRASDTSAIVK